MLRSYRQAGASRPVTAHEAAGGPDDRRLAYAANRRLREAGFVEHVGRGLYEASLADVVADLADRSGTALSPADVEAILTAAERREGLVEADVAADESGSSR